jgi:hypothetical protein
MKDSVRGLLGGVAGFLLALLVAILGMSVAILSH